MPGETRQVAILAGGKGTRLRPLVGDLPKAMAPVHGRPFLRYQLELLRDKGVRNVLLCLGYGADEITSYVGDGRWLGLEVQYSIESQPLGTAGALVHAAEHLDDSFFVLYGDSYLLLDYAEIAASFRRGGTLGLMVVFHNQDRYDRSNVVVRDGRVVGYSKAERTPDTVYIDEGLSVLDRRALDLLPRGRPADLTELFTLLVQRGELLAYETPQRFYEIGSPEGFAEFSELARTGALASSGHAKA